MDRFITYIKGGTSSAAKSLEFPVFLRYCHDGECNVGEGPVAIYFRRFSAKKTALIYCKAHNLV